MLVPKKNRLEVYKYLFKEGVLCAEKDTNLPKHPDLPVPNLQVIKLMQSFVSKEYVREQFAWRHYYWYLTDEGIEYLREYLNIPTEVVPATLRKTQRTGSRPTQRDSDRPRGPGGYDRRGGDRDRYRGSGGYGDKAGAPGEYRPEFRSGFGRGGGIGRGGGEAPPPQ